MLYISISSIHRHLFKSVTHPFGDKEGIRSIFHSLLFIVKKYPPALFIAAFSLLASMPTSGQTYFNGQYWYPKPLPQYQPAKNKNPLIVNQPVRFNLQTRTEIVLDEKAGTAPSKGLCPGSPGELPVAKTTIEPESLVKALGPLELVTDPVSNPARKNVKLFVKKGSNCWECSGSLIDSRHILTAGHCIYDGGWADTVFVVPAFTGDPSSTCMDPYGVAPLGVALAVADMMSWTGWTQQNDFEWDMGVLFLERPVGALAGWFGFSSSEYPDFYGDNIWHNFSYPAEDPYDGNYMYYRQVGMSYHYESVTIFDPEPSFWDSLYVYHLDYSYGGQSGSGYYRNWLGDRIAHAVVSHGNTSPDPGGDNYTGIAYIHYSQFDQIVDYQNDNISDELDLIALWARTSTVSIPAGSMIDDFSYIVHNYSHPTYSGDLEANVYLSIDKIITADDIWLGAIEDPGIVLPERSTKTINATGDQLFILPDTARGDYYIGVILSLEDVDLNNNSTVNWDVDKITVLNLQVSPEHLQAAVIGDTLHFNIGSNTYWFISEDAPWLNISQLNGTGDATVQVTCIPNPSSQAREYTLLVVGPNGIIRQVTVWQEGVDLNASPASLEVPACGGGLSFSVAANFPWTLNGSASWVETQLVDENVHLQFEPNNSTQSRQVVFDVIAGQVVIQIVLTQQGAELTAIPANFSISPNGEQSEVLIFSNTCWQVESNAAWLSFNQTSGEGDSILEFTTELNCGDSRQATVTLIAEGSDILQTILVTQEGAYFNVSPTAAQAESSGSNITANVSTNLSWTATSNVAWLTINPSIGTGSGSVYLLLQTNTTLFPRQANVTVSTACGVEQITITQAGQSAFLSIAPDTLNFPSTADTQIVVIYSNVSWSITDKPAWVSVNPSSDLGFDSVTVICQPNPLLGNSRSGIIKITAIGLQQEIFVFQKKKTIISVPGDPAPDPNTAVLLLAPSGNNDEVSSKQPELNKQTRVEPDSGVTNLLSLAVFPNPAHSIVNISFTLPTAQAVRLEILDFSGRQVALPARGELPSGEHTVAWNPEEQSPGIYICRLTAVRTVAIRIVLQ